MKAYPKDFDAYANLGELYKKLDKTDLAIKNLEQAYKLNDTDVEVMKDLAFSYHKKLDYENALKFYDLA
ncbi:tetratricopeptide repeat protein, partial [bacterium]|nr:tetratricopeptide repeat protein [bacterium]